MIPEIIQQDAKLAELVRRLVKAYRPDRLYLFGSRGRKEAETGGDYDLLLVLSELNAPTYRIAQQVHRLYGDWESLPTSSSGHAKNSIGVSI